MNELCYRKADVLDGSWASILVSNGRQHLQMFADRPILCIPRLRLKQKDGEPGLMKRVQ